MSAIPLRNDRPAAEASTRVDPPIRVLYALDQFPQLSESYINAEIERMLEWGVEVEVWSSTSPKSEGRPVDVPIHRGTLVETIQRRKPEIVHTHWTQSALKYKDAAKRMGVPMTARGHWHFVPKQIQKVEDEPTIVRLFMFPHLANKWKSMTDKIVPMLACYHHEWVAPRRPKNRKMLMRTAACKRSKDLANFIRIAAKLPDYRSVMILCSLGPNDYYRELEALNRELGSPVEMVRDITYEEVAAYMAEAGLYVHTYDPDVSFGMPVSIVEAMAAGCTVLARDVEGASAYLGDTGRVYKDLDEAAALVRATESWSELEWQEAERRSRERAARHFDDRQILVPLLDTWKDIAAERRAAGDESLSMVEKFRRWSGLGYKRV
ncbi:hypothetical protein GCM10011390_06110 [Aureimonas endophytica]|uniref:Glycosyl transferase family 1 domain-containing protein n=1 Tax=Aureimonas endophytica TaxID=2027858 RepID=A0A916ZDJ0_9HYPH|nr:glycosyltransferase [Aureimonas endophytica]GGD90064.1 hypothetical protein GCM10011390_06110 [Aureimonas endophytica]